MYYKKKIPTLKGKFDGKEVRGTEENKKGDVGKTGMRERNRIRRNIKKIIKKCIEYEENSGKKKETCYKGKMKTCLKQNTT